MDRQSDQGTPAKSLGGVYASSEADAVKEAAKEFNVADALQFRVVAVKIEEAKKAKVKS